MTNPLESGLYRLYVWEVGGSDAEPTDTGETGTLAVLMELGQSMTDGQAAGRQVEVDGREITLAGFVVKPEPAE